MAKVVTSGLGHHLALRQIGGGEEGFMIYCSRCGAYAAHKPQRLGVACPGRRSKEGDKALARISKGRHPDHKKRQVVLQEEVVLGRFDASRPDLFADRLGMVGATRRIHSQEMEQEPQERPRQEAVCQHDPVNDAEMEAMMLGIDEPEANFEDMLQQQDDEEMACNSVQGQPS